MAQIPVKKYISKEELRNYPLIKFQGKIFILTNREKAEYYAANLLKFKLLGFDTESLPYRSKQQLELIQICTDNECYLFRIKRCGMPDNLIKVFENQDIIKVGVAIKSDIKEIQKIKNFTPANFIDLQQIAKSYGIESISLSKLSAIFLGHRVSKRQQRSNWGRSFLSEGQIIYAATDAWVALKIYQKIKTMLENDNK